MADPRVRNMKIKTGVVKRLIKEKVSYEKEATKDEEKVEKMKADGKDEHDIKKQNEVLQESKAMIPDTVRRLRTAYEELNNLLKAEEDLAETDDYKEAQKVVEEAEKVPGVKNA